MNHIQAFTGIILCYGVTILYDDVFYVHRILLVVLDFEDLLFILLDLNKSLKIFSELHLLLSSLLSEVEDTMTVQNWFYVKQCVV